MSRQAHTVHPELGITFPAVLPWPSSERNLLAQSGRPTVVLERMSPVHHYGGCTGAHPAVVNHNWADPPADSPSST
jgi:hypothetical protein